jgi:hypothetical protein
VSDDAIDMAELRAQLAECKSSLRELEVRAQQAQGAEKTKYEEQVSNFRKRLIDIQDKLLEMKSVEEDNWQDVKQEAESAWKKLKRSLKEAKTEFKKGYDEGLEK